MSLVGIDYPFHSAVSEHFDTLEEANKAVFNNPLPFPSFTYRVFENASGGFSVETLVNGKFEGFLNTKVS
jgi:hypothetical protein|tara:strand:+ start:253 stop:462 length:210 start_codon:yes stop_codon:yes gene_type:complete